MPALTALEATTKTRLALLAMSVVAAGNAMAGGLPKQDSIVHPLLAAQGGKVPDEAVLVVEIPAGGSIKYELDERGLLVVDRYLQMPVAYPANYGSMPRSAGQDGDPLDALVLTRAPVQPGALIRFRPVAVLHMLDDGVNDDKIIGVPVDDVDPAYAGIRDVHDLPQLERDRIEAFFRVYKQLPEGRNRVELDGFGDAREARALMEESLSRFRQRKTAAG